MINNILFFAGRCLFFITVFIALVPAGYGAQQNKEQNEIKLIVGTYIPVGYDPYLYPCMKRFIDMGNERGKGKVQLDMYWGGTLLKAKDLLPGLYAGSADLIFVPSTYLAGTYPILGIQAMPLWDTLLASYESLKSGSPLAAYENRVLKEKNIIQLSAAGVLFEFLWTRNKLVQSPEDMKGLKIRVPGKVQAKIIQSLGAIPVTLPSAELPQALQRGVVDGAIMNPWTAQGRGIEEYCKYILVHPICGISNSLFVLNDNWDKLPEDVRKLLIEISKEYEKIMFGTSDAMINDKQLADEIIPYYESKGMIAVYANEENARKFKEAIKPAVSWWVKEVGQEIGNKVLGYIYK